MNPNIPEKFQKDIVEFMLTASMRTGMVRGASKDVIAERLAICGTCPEFNGTKCNLCGCFMAQKARLANSTCPKSKWTTA